MQWSHSSCCGVARLPFTNNERNLKAQEPKPKLRHKQKKTKSSFSTVNFSKVYPLYKCRSVSFYRGGEWTFTYREYARVKRIKIEYARLFLGSLQLGLHVTGTPWRHVANRGAFFAIVTCVSGEDLETFGELPFAWHIPETQITVNFKSINH
jgi:hypothetical protein